MSYMDWGKLLYATNRMQFCLFVVFQFEEKKYTFPLLVCYSQLSEMNSLSHPQNVLWLKACLMHWVHSSPFSSGPKTLVTRQFQHMPFPPHLPAATHNSIGQNVCKNSQEDECCCWKNSNLGLCKNWSEKEVIYHYIHTAAGKPNS